MVEVPEGLLHDRSLKGRPSCRRGDVWRGIRERCRREGCLCAEPRMATVAAPAPSTIQGRTVEHLAQAHGRRRDGHGGDARRGAGPGRGPATCRGAWPAAAGDERAPGPLGLPADDQPAGRSLDRLHRPSRRLGVQPADPHGGTRRHLGRRRDQPEAPAVPDPHPRSCGDGGERRRPDGAGLQRQRPAPRRRREVLPAAPLRRPGAPDLRCETGIAYLVSGVPAGAPSA